MSIHKPNDFHRVMSHPHIRGEHPDYRWQVAHRYLVQEKLSVEMALRCLDAAYTSPSAARWDRILPRKQWARFKPAIGLDYVTANEIGMKPCPTQ